MQVDLSDRRARNLSVLQRRDGNVTDIVSEYSLVGLWEFVYKASSWEKLGFEGSSFITRNRSKPFYKFIGRRNSELASSPTDLFIYSFIRLFIHSFIHSFIFSIYLSL